MNFLEIGEVKGRSDRSDGDGLRDPAQRYVSGRAGEQAQGACPHLRQDEKTLHPYSSGRQSSGRALAVRSDARAHHVSLQVSHKS